MHISCFNLLAKLKKKSGLGPSSLPSKGIYSLEGIYSFVTHKDALNKSKHVAHKTEPTFYDFL